jgi:sugar lactone lactonase YvrE
VIGTHPAQVLMSRPGRVAFRIPEQATSGLIEVRTPTGVSNAAPIRVARELSSGLHPVTSPAVSRSGMIYATISGQRGKQTPVSVVRISPDGRGTPFVTGILNPTGLAFSPEGDLFVTSRAEGNVYRIDGAGESTLYAEGMGVATGAVFDPAGNLFVGDRSGTIFKISPSRQIFVFATLEPSISAYHLTFGPDGYLYVTGPTTSSFDAVFRIDHEGQVETFYRGLGRPQGMAFDEDGRLYVAASIAGRKGVVRIDPDRRADLFLSGPGIVGLAFTPSRSMVVATTNAIHRVDVGIKGRPLY